MQVAGEAAKFLKKLKETGLLLPLYSICLLILLPWEWFVSEWMNLSPFLAMKTLKLSLFLHFEYKNKEMQGGREQWDLNNILFSKEKIFGW